jgi:hypothetical protein
MPLIMREGLVGQMQASVFNCYSVGVILVDVSYAGDWPGTYQGVFEQLFLEHQTSH